MFAFTLEWASRGSVAERAIDARAVTDRLLFREAFIFPLIPSIIFLFALGIMTGTHLQGRAGRALPSTAFAGMSLGMGVPVLYPASDSCRRLSNLGSKSQLQQVDVLALLSAD